MDASRKEKTMIPARSWIVEWCQLVIILSTVAVKFSVHSSPIPCATSQSYDQGWHARLKNALHQTQS